MSEHKIKINWQRNTSDFNYETYDRTHTINFSGGEQIEASAAPEYSGNPKLPNPEELLVAAVSSCYMLTFLALCAKQKFVINSYQDDAKGILGKNAAGKMAITEIILHPTINFSGDNQPDAPTLKTIREKAHTYCFITQSVNATVKVE